MIKSDLPINKKIMSKNNTIRLNTKNLKHLRVINGMSQEDFGAELGMKASSVSLMENGRPVFLSTLRKICLAFEVKPEYLILQD